MFDKLTRSVKDAADVLKHVKSLKAAAQALLPPSMIERRVLNLGEASGVGGDAAQIAQALRELRNRLKVEAIDEQGRVDYARLRGSDSFAELEATSRLLRSIGPEQLPGDDERLAFWINLYNVLSIHGVIALGIDSSVMEQPAFFSTIAYQIGAHTVTPDEIENGILRRNGRHPFSGARLFKEGDGRLDYCPSQVDPRIHAALVCASKSCPPVRFYEAEHIHEQLDTASRGYVAAEVEISGDSVQLPITFRYYLNDFGGDAGVISFLLDHAEGEHKARLRERFDAGAPISYARYDWSLNGQL